MHFRQWKRREFIALLGGAATWPPAARAQQPAMPMIGFLHPGSPEANAKYVAGFRKGLGEIGLCRGPRCFNRISLGARRGHAAAGAGGRPGQAGGERSS